jgi:molybdopterin/thiamine biosynthesis adenylyltransferase
MRTLSRATLMLSLPTHTCGHTQVDLDTIDETNLNRQFLFNKENVAQNQTKCQVAVAVARKMNPNGDYQAVFGSIYDKRFDLAFFRTFDVVFGALDSVGMIDERHRDYWSRKICIVLATNKLLHHHLVSSSDSGA